MKNRIRTQIAAWSLVFALGLGFSLSQDIAPGGSAKVIALGDMHGDFATFTALLQRIGLIDDDRNWSGDDVTLIQTGDFLDRGPDSREIVALLRKLQRQSEEAGGRVEVLMGNHEALNLVGFYSAVNASDFSEYAKNEGPLRQKNLNQLASFGRTRNREVPAEIANWVVSQYGKSELYPSGYFGRQKALSQHQTMGQWLRNRPLMVKIAGTLFMHAGINPDPSRNLVALEAANQSLRAAISEHDAGKQRLVDVGILPPFLDMDAIRKYYYRFREINPTSQAFFILNEWVTKLNDSILLEPEGLLWNRRLVMSTSEVDQLDQINRILDFYGVKRIVIGHTYSVSGRVQNILDGRVWVIDTGATMSPQGTPSALLIEDDKVRVLAYPDLNRVRVTKDYPN